LGNEGAPGYQRPGDHGEFDTGSDMAALRGAEVLFLAGGILLAGQTAPSISASL